MRVQAGRLLLTISSAVLALGASAATGTTIHDLVRIKGHEHNVLTGLGIVINEKQGIILITGNVEIAPVGITHKGLSITRITPSPVPTPAQPVYSTRRWVDLYTSGRQTRQATRLLDLLTALEQLNVPVEDQIAVIYELKKTGALHAQIVDK